MLLGRLIITCKIGNARLRRGVFDFVWGVQKHSTAICRQFEFNERTRICDGLIRIIIHGNFRFRHRRRKLRIIHQDLPPLINLPRFIQGLKRPPYRLHKIFIHRPIAIIKIHPAPNSINRPAPSFRICYHRFTRFNDVIFQRNRVLARTTNLPTVCNIQLFLHKVLRRQSMTIPAPTSFHALPLHRPISRHSIFHNRRE